MRTTLTIDDELLEAAGIQAKARGVSLSRSVSDLIRRGLDVPAQVAEENGVYVVRLPEGSPTVTTDDVKRLESDIQ